MPSAQSMTQWLRANPTRMLAVGVGIGTLGLSLWVGLRARAVATEVAARRAAWEQMANQLATVQQQFRVPTSTESAALLDEAGRLGSLAISPADKLNLVDMLGRLAEACALSSVRVNAVAPPDSTFVVDRVVSGTPVKTADYVLSVEFSGSFANARKFVSSLPPSVSISRIAGARQDGGALYQLILSVYELDGPGGN